VSWYGLKPTTQTTETFTSFNADHRTSLNRTYSLAVLTPLYITSKEFIANLKGFGQISGSNEGESGETSVIALVMAVASTDTSVNFYQITWRYTA
jgi:hypothetical protein